MHLDESILQSTTTLNLVEFIDKLWERVEPREYGYVALEKVYFEIMEKAFKAKKKRSF